MRVTPHRIRSLRPIRRCSPAIVVAAAFTALLGAGQGWTAPAGTGSADEQAAIEQYVAKLKALFETRIVPDLRRGIVKIAASRPPGLTISVTEDPSPYKIGARVDPDGRLSVQLTLSYTTMHDAALDAAALSSVLHRPRDLGPYLIYQLRIVHENYGHRARGEGTRHAMTFAEFIGLDPNVTRTIYAQPEWRASRDEAEAQSLGWTVAYLLARVDPKLSGALPIPSSRAGTAAARLAAASDWFPVPPFATALELADVTRSPSGDGESRTLLCPAALMMESGLAALHGDAVWRARLKTDSALQKQATHIQEQIAEMRHDGGCASAGVAPL